MKRNNQKKFRMEQTRRPKKNPLKAEGIEKVEEDFAAEVAKAAQG